MVQEFNILNITYPFMLANDVTISKEKNDGKKNLIFQNPRWRPAAILKMGGSVISSII